jgi:hypothetical protein
MRCILVQLEEVRGIVFSLDGNEPLACAGSDAIPIPSLLAISAGPNAFLLSLCGRHTALVATLTLRLGDPFTLALKIASPLRDQQRRSR